MDIQKHLRDASDRIGDVLSVPIDRVRDRLASPPIKTPFGKINMEGDLPARDDLPKLFDELDFQMGVQAYLWALPLVSFAEWQNQHETVFGATSTDIVVYSSYRDKLGLLTANATTPYILNFIDLSRTGPMVVELPPGPTAGGVCDFWQREIGIIGEMGPDQGNGGKHLVVPPGREAPDVSGYFIMHSTMMNVMIGFRSLIPDPEKSKALIDAVKLYPYDKRDIPSTTRVLSPDGRPWSGMQPRGLRYWERLHAIYQTEPVEERDRFFLAMLRQLGIEKGKPFAPDKRQVKLLTAAAEAGELINKANTFDKRFAGSRYWPDRHWDLAIVLSHSSQRADNYDEYLERAAWFYEAVTFSEAMKSQTPGLGQAYLGAYTDGDGDWLDGAKNYRLHVSANPPAKLFWSATVYDTDTRCLINNDQQRGDRSSRDQLMLNEDGSVDLFFGPTTPEGKEDNWVQTIPGKHWFSYFRLYGPLDPYFDKSWKLDDITAVVSE